MDDPRIDRPVVIDASGHIAGRLASHVAKMLLQGHRVSLINCENIMLSGTRSMIIKEYRDFLEISSILNPKHGPFHPRRPDTIITRMVRGMLPRKKPSGKTAFGRLRAYVGLPSHLRHIDSIRLKKAEITREPAVYVTMSALSKTVGWNQ
ncbi:MAG: ribosomal protein L13 [Cenarchaeum symbiont of Oopsacas minuta]|nr:ribosomal protein L13 [Cenarchaeum symbiont of Oopsacas minuta]